MLSGSGTRARVTARAALAATALLVALPGFGCRYSGPPRPDAGGDARLDGVGEFDAPFPPEPDALALDGAGADAPASDQGTRVDAQPPPADQGFDSGPPPVDATPVDAGPPPDRTLGPEQSGSAAWYDAVGVVACENLDGDTMVTSINGAQYNGSAACGMCVRVTGPAGSVVVRVVDRCGSCSTGGLVLNRPAFTAIAPLSAGRVSVTWQPVTCDVMGPIEYRINDGANSSYLSVQVRNHRVPVQRLEVFHGGTFVAMSRQLNDYFTYSGAGGGPYVLRVTASDGQTLVDSGIVLAPGSVQPGGDQFR